jgi:hypothetical protein
MTSEQAEAFARVRKLADRARLRVRPNAEGWPIIPGRLGQIEWYCNGQDCHSCPLPRELALAVYTDRPRLFPKLWAIPGVRRWQTGDREMRAVFPPEALTLVAGVIRARRRATRLMTPARLAGLAAAREKLRAACPRATWRLQDRAEARTLDQDTSGGAGGGRITELRALRAAE